jgi:hypothetical protein
MSWELGLLWRWSAKKCWRGLTSFVKFHMHSIVAFRSYLEGSNRPHRAGLVPNCHCPHPCNRAGVVAGELGSKNTE